MRRMEIGELLNVSDAVRRHLRERRESRDIIEKVIAKKIAGHLILVTAGSGVWSAIILDHDKYHEYADEIFAKNYSLEMGRMVTVILLNDYLNNLT